MNFFDILIYILLIAIVYWMYKGGTIRREIRILFLPIVFLGVALGFILFKYDVTAKMMVSLLVINIIVGVIGGIALAFLTKLEMKDNGVIYREGGILIAGTFVLILLIRFGLSRRLAQRIGGQELHIVSLFLALSIQFLIRNILVSRRIKKLKKEFDQM